MRDYFFMHFNASACIPIFRRVFLAKLSSTQNESVTVPVLNSALFSFCRLSAFQIGVSPSPEPPLASALASDSDCSVN